MMKTSIAATVGLMGVLGAAAFSGAAQAETLVQPRQQSLMATLSYAQT